MKKGLILLLIAMTLACSSDKQNRLFQRVDLASAGIDFKNQLDYDERLNAYTHRNFYNGAGVAVGDINNDGLVDIYLAGNLADNKLYLNKGNFQFEDITESAGVSCPNVWSTGVSFADVNGDGLLDLYVCKSGPQEGENRHNELFINNGDLTFSEKAAEYGVNDLGLSNHAAFLDYDKDGDLDFYLLNNSTRSVGIYDLREGQRNIRDSTGANKLYRNDGDFFTDVSEEAGIYGSAIGYGLGVTIADINRDGWQDLFVSNDFFERDYLYINNQDGTFREMLEELTTETSMGSMGADIADLNNDGYPEIYVTEMLPESWERIKTKTVFEDWDKYQANVKSGYHHQFTRNALQLNNGLLPDGDNPFFSEISRQTGLHATDWSWGALIFDVDNDGLKDVFVANGIFKDLTDQDYINFYANNALLFDEYRKDSLVITKLMDAIPSVPLTNYLFMNQGGLSFENMSEVGGFEQPSFSNGAAYADFDNDGDLDLLVNNINDAPFLYKNTAESKGNHFLLLELTSGSKNRFALGAQVNVHAGKLVIYNEQTPVKGYMSTVDHRLHIGLGNVQAIDSVRVLWPNGIAETFKDISIDQIVKLKEPASSETMVTIDTNRQLGLFQQSEIQLPYVHQENEFVDFNRDRLLFQMNSNEGPSMVTADVDGDGLEDYYLGGAKGQPGTLLIQKENGSFESTALELLAENSNSEDTDALFFDADGDGDMDLFVASGGNAFSDGSRDLKDRLYINQGNGSFALSIDFATKAKNESTAFIKTLDFDGDGDQDLITGSRLRPFAYGIPMSAFLWQNDGDGNFSDVTAEKASAFKELGLLTDAAVIDFDQDNDPDILMAGQWMGIKLFENKEGTFVESNSSSLANKEGLWNSVQIGDFNQDGKMDFVAGNHGLNSRFQSSEAAPMELFINDFDRNGSIEHITTQHHDGGAYPIVLLQDLVKQIPSLRKKYLKFDDYKSQRIDDIFTPEELENSIRLKVSTLASTLFLNQGNGNFQSIALPKEAQVSPVYAIHVSDLNEDGIPDLLLGGNQTKMKPEIGINNASFVTTLLGDATGNFQALNASESGIYVKGEIRDIKEISLPDGDAIAFVRNDDTVIIFERSEKK